MLFLISSVSYGNGTVAAYTYDSLYRLVQAVGYAGVPPAACNPAYVLKTAFSPAGRLLSKTLSAQSHTLQTDYSRTYTYYDAQPHTVRTVDNGRH